MDDGLLLLPSHDSYDTDLLSICIHVVGLNSHDEIFVIYAQALCRSGSALISVQPSTHQPISCPFLSFILQALLGALLLSSQ